jgi:hypothetical protein
MAGRYQGRHIIPEAEGQVSFEVVWQNAGWFWRPPDGDAVGPFTTSSQSYQSAVTEAAAAARLSASAAVAVVAAAEAGTVGHGPALAGFGLANQSASESKNLRQ